MRFLNSFKQKNISVAYLYFYIHLVTEVLCFFCLSRLIGDSIIFWVIPFMYDAFAFVPQSLIGAFSDKHKNINMGLIGVILLLIGFTLFFISNIYLSIIILCLGNCFIHVSGACTTLRASNGSLAHSAIFVGGGSFGVITGKLLAKTNIPWYLLIVLGLSMIPYILLADVNNKESNIKNFNYQNKKIKPSIIILLTVFVVIVRAYMGYGIPTSWNKTVLQTILLYVSMGCGKCLGGILADSYGAKKIGLISIIGALPFLCFGDNNMYLSLIGICLFSMTMSICLGVLVSVLKNSPGLAFGLTTIGLFLGTIPTFFFKFTTVLSNCIVISILSIICLLIFCKVLKGDKV